MKPIEPTIHYYAPIALYNGRVLKYQGMASEDNRQWMAQKYPGLVELAEYKGDRILADTHQPFDGMWPQSAPVAKRGAHHVRGVVINAARMAGSESPAWGQVSDALGHVVSVNTKDKVLALGMVANPMLAGIVWC